MRGTTRLDEKGVVISCPSCAQRNRVAYDRLGQTSRCGRCKASLPALDVPLEAESDSQVNALLHASTLPVLVDFWAPWCGPCKMLAPELGRLAAANKGQIVLVKVNTEELPVTAQMHRITALPTLVLFMHGREVQRLSGAGPAPVIQEWLDAQMASAA